MSARSTDGSLWSRQLLPSWFRAYVCGPELDYLPGESHTGSVSGVCELPFPCHYRSLGLLLEKGPC